MRTQTVYLIGRRKRNSDGDWIGPPVAKKPLAGAVLWPRASEQKDGGEVNIDGENVKLRDGEVERTIRADDHVEIDGQIHMVDEPPARYRGRAILMKTKRVYT